MRSPGGKDHGYPIMHAIWNVKNLGGLVYFFSPDGINWDTRTVRGFVHVPGKVDWEAGEFPFPQAVYRRIAIPSKMEDEMKRFMTPHIFNTVRLGNKLIQFQLMSDDPALRRYLPETRRWHRKRILTRSSTDMAGRTSKTRAEVRAPECFVSNRARRGGWRVRLQQKNRSATLMPGKSSLRTSAS